VASGASIVSAGLDNGKSAQVLQLTSGFYGRQFYFGSGWHRLAICLLVQFGGVATFAADLAIGVCSGTTNMFNSATCTNWLGQYNDPASPSTWTFNAGVNHPFYTQSVSTRWATRRVNTTTDRGGGTSSDGRAYGAASDGRTLIYIELSRPVAATTATGVTYNGAVKSTNSTQAEFPVSRHEVLDIFSDTITSVLGATPTGNIITGSPTNTLTGFTFDESTGVFDTLNINWNKASPSMRLHAIGVHKIY
jgi:hypothetical protein